MELSTFNLDKWPHPQKLKRLCQTLTVLTLCQNDRERYTFRISNKDGLAVAGMRNGEGDEAEIVFTEQGTIFRGFDHEAPLASWYTENEKAFAGTFAGYPEALKALKKEYLDDEETSFVTWFLNSENYWSKGKVQPPDELSREEDADGSLNVMSYFPFSYQDYIKDAEYYYEIKLSSKAVQAVYQHAPLTNELINQLNKNCAFNCRSKEFTETGYPIG